MFFREFKKFYKKDLQIKKKKGIIKDVRNFLD